MCFEPSAAKKTLHLIMQLFPLYDELANCENPVPLYPEWFKCCSQNSNKKDTLCGALYMTILGGGGGGVRSHITDANFILISAHAGEAHIDLHVHTHLLILGDGM